MIAKNYVERLSKEIIDMLQEKFEWESTKPDEAFKLADQILSKVSTYFENLKDEYEEKNRRAML